MDSNYGDVAQSWRMSSQAPLDAKTMVNRLTDLTDLGTGNTKPFLYHRGMKIYCHQNKKSYEWTDDLNDNQTKLLTNDFVYPTGSEYDGINYQGLSFNFVEVQTVYSIRENFLENEGVGVEFFNGINLITKNSKIAKLNSSTQKITKETDGSVKTEIDVFNRGSEDGISLYEFFPGTKMHGVSKIKSGNIIITKDEDGTLNINTPGGGGTTSSFYYLDPNYSRPSNWGEDTNPKVEILNTTIHPTLKKIPTGRLNDPFIDYTEFLLFAVGNAADSNSYGNYTTANPKNSGVLQILSSVITHQKIEVNAWNVFLNKADLIHSGLETYSLDMRRLWTSENLDPITGKIKRPIGFILGGEGELSRTLGLGLIYSKGDVNKTTAELSYNFTFLPTGLGIRIVEARNPFPDTNPNVRLTRADGTTLLSNGNSPVFGRVQEPTTPLIVIDSGTFGYWGTIVQGTKLFIVASTQSHIKFINGAGLTSSAEQIMYQVENAVVGYERKMIENAPGNTADENLFLATRKVGAEVGFFYKPFEGYNVFDIDDGIFRVENLSTEPNGFLHAGANAVVNIKGVNSVFNNMVSWRDTGGGPALKLLQITGVPKYIKITSLDLASVTDIFAKGDAVSTANIILSNTKINSVRKITEDVPNLNIYTEGTLCSIQGRSIITLVNYANNDDALDDGLIKDMLYRNNVTGVITQVI